MIPNNIKRPAGRPNTRIRGDKIWLAVIQEIEACDTICLAVKALVNRGLIDKAQANALKTFLYWAARKK